MLVMCGAVGISIHKNVTTVVQFQTTWSGGKLLLLLE